MANCWDTMECPKGRKQECPAFKINRGDKCWLLTDTLCKGEKKGTMIEKMASCKNCKFYQDNNRIIFMGIKGKFYIVTALILLMVGYLGLFSLYQMKNNNDHYNELIQYNVGVISDTKNALIEFEKGALDLRGYILTGQDRYLRNYRNDKQNFEKYMTEIKSLLRTDQGKELYVVLQNNYDIFCKYADTAIEIRNTKTINDVIKYIEQNPGVNNNVVNAAKKLIEYDEKLLIEGQEASDRMIYYTTKAIIISLAIVLLLCIVASAFLTASISKPLLSLEKQTNRIASGDLTASHVLIKNRDEIGSLANAYNQMINSLKDIVNRVAEKAVDVSSASRQLSSSAEQTAASASETTSTIFEIAQSVNQVSNNAQVVADEAQNVSSHAATGWEDIESITQQMEDIKQSTQSILEVIKRLNDKSGEITKIVELITQISDQTNLLALNAAIEAARAGDAGRGFAVVAEEVRKLAEQSNLAAKEIFNLIQAIQNESHDAVGIAEKGSESVKEGTGVIIGVGNSFKNIIDSVHKLSKEIQNVATSTIEMSDGMQNIASVSQEQNAVMEEISASSQTMAKTAQELNHIASLFKR